MGIQGLLPLLKYCMEDVNIKKFTRKRCAVDTYSWIHKAIYGSASDIVANPNSSKWISYCMTYLDMLLGNNMEVYLVFDGDSLIAKKSTEGTRSENRKKNLEEGMRCLSNGDYTSARSHMARGIDVTPHMAAKFIQVCKMYRPNVRIVVAPYEADAQLSFMSINNIVDIIITEDSDLIAFGCKEVIYKLDRYSGSCQYIRYDNIFRPISDTEVKPSNRNNAISAEDNMNSSQKDAESPGTGYAIKSAYKTVSKCRSSQKILKNLRFGGQLPMTTVSVEVPVEMYHATGANMMMSQQGTTLLSQSQPSSSQDSLYLSQTENLYTNNGSYSVEDRRACHVLDRCYPVQLCVDKIQEWKKIDILKYELQFYQAMLTFHHQVVFDVIHREMCYLKPLHGHGPSSSADDNSIATLSNYSLLPASTDIPAYMLFARECGDSKTTLSYLGTIIGDKDLACGIADGMIDPISKEYFNLPPLNEAIARTFSPAASSSKQKQATNKNMFAISKTNSVSIVRQSSLSSTNPYLSHESRAGNLFTPFDNDKNMKSICSTDISDDCITHKSKTTESMSSSPPLLEVFKHGDTQSQMTTSHSSINSFRSSAERNYSNNFLKRFLTESSSTGPRNVMLPTASDDKLNTSIASLSSSIQSNKRLSTTSCPSSSSPASSHSRHRHEASSLMFDQFNSKLENARSLSCTSNSQHLYSASKPPAGIMKFLKKTSVYVSTPTSVSIANLNMTASKKANDRINQLADLSHQYKKNKVYDVNIDDKFTKKHVASDSNGIASSFDEMFGYHDDCGNYNESGQGQETTYCDSMSPPIPVLKSCGRILTMPAMSGQQKRASEFSLDALQSSYLGSCKKNPICLLDQDSPQWTCASEGENINKDSAICDSTCFVARSSDCDRHSSGDITSSESLSEKVSTSNDPSDLQVVFGRVQGQEDSSERGMREPGTSSNGVGSCSLAEGCVTHDSTHVISDRDDSSEAEGVHHVKEEVKKTSKKKTSVSSENVHFTGTSTSLVVPEIQLYGNSRRATRRSKSSSKVLNEHKNMKFVSFDGFEYKDE